MPHRDDLIGLLRSFDGVMKTLEPPPGHEARLRARLSPQEWPRVTRPLAIGLCAALAGAAAWLVWTSSRAPEPSALPLGAPSASGIAAEPRPDPSSSSQPLRPSPRRSVPALPLLPPHTDLAPAPRPPSDVPPSPADIADPAPAREARARTADAPSAARAGNGAANDRSRRQPLSRGQSTSPSISWTAPPSAGAHPAGLTSMGSFAGDARPNSPSPAGASHGTSSTAGSKQPTSISSSPDPTCEPVVLDFGDGCAPPEDLKDVALGVCADKGLSLTALDVALDCGAQGIRVAKLTCCPPGGSAPPGNDPYVACKPITAGDGATCVDPGILEKQAAVTCASWGMTFAKAEIGLACANGTAALVDALCCPNTASSADPGLQPAGAVGDGASCVPDDKLEDAANSLCLEQGLTLVDFYAMDDCDADASTAAKYICGK